MSDRERVRGDDLSYLIIAPKDREDSLYNRCINDVIALRDTGAIVKIIIPKDGVTDKAIEKELVDYEYDINGSTSIFDFHRLRNIVKIISDFNPDIILSYDFRFLFSLYIVSLFKPNLSLVYYTNNHFKLYLPRLILKLIFRKIDRLFLTSNHLSSWYNKLVGVSHIKFSELPLGVKIQSKIAKKESGNKIIIGAIFREKKAIKKLRTFLYSLPNFLKKSGLSRDKVVFRVLFPLSDLPPDQRVIINRFIKEMGLKDFLEFLPKTDLHNELLNFDVLVSFQSRDFLDEYELMALGAKIPLVVPRSTWRFPLITSERDWGESYKQGDSRELSVKLFHVVSNLSYYQQAISQSSSQFVEKHDQERYYQQFFSELIAQVEKRKRLIRK